MSDRKTRPTEDSADSVLSKADPGRRAQAEEVLALMDEVTGQQPIAWGSMIGFGRHTYATADGKAHETFAVGLAAKRR